MKISLDVANKGFDIYKGHKTREVEFTVYGDTMEPPLNKSTSFLRLSDLTQDVNYPKSDNLDSNGEPTSKAVQKFMRDNKISLNNTNFEYDNSKLDPIRNEESYYKKSEEPLFSMASTEDVAKKTKDVVSEVEKKILDEIGEVKVFNRAIF